MQWYFALAIYLSDKLDSCNTILTLIPGPWDERFAVKVMISWQRNFAMTLFKSLTSRIQQNKIYKCEKQSAKKCHCEMIR